MHKYTAHIISPCCTWYVILFKFALLNYSICFFSRKKGILNRNSWKYKWLNFSLGWGTYIIGW